jgi:hypothetical protein
MHRQTDSKVGLLVLASSQYWFRVQQDSWCLLSYGCENRATLDIEQSDLIGVHPFQNKESGFTYLLTHGAEPF